MRRTLPLMVTVPCLATWLATGPAHAQESTTRGFNIGVHGQGASLKVQDGDRSNAAGGGIWIGYGFNQTIQLFLQIDRAEFDVEDTDVEGRWTLGHGDIGVRYHFARSPASLVPYLQASGTYRVVNVSNAVVLGQSENDVRISGPAITLGGGFMIFFRRTLALDLQLLWSGVDLQVNSVTVSGIAELDARSTRFNIGIAWWP